MRSPLRRLLCASLAFAAALIACSSEDHKAAPIDSIGCEDGGPSCGVGANTSVQPAKDSGADAVADARADADAEPPKTTTLSITVGVLDSAFSSDTAVELKSAAVLSIPTINGQKDLATGGDAGASVLAEDVLTGTAWFQVRPTTLPDLYATHSLLTVRETDTALLVPVVDRVQLGALYTSTPLAPILKESAAQIAAIFVNELGARVSGVRVTDKPFALDGILYDVGPGAYQSDDGTTRTGPAGIAIFANVTGGIGSFSYERGAVSHLSPSITWVIGQATIAVVTVPSS